ncbi:MAG: serine/threonine protein kinase, partial [Actinomycetia bacterium]|nr:serine/threonine protein kinase [Actinomycetes bacterium]
MKGVNTSGDRIGHYRLLEILGEGGMGVVHLAVDPQGRKVAIKVLRPQVAGDVTALRRLAREVDTMRRVHSPHVAEILDADVTAERPYIVTQFVPGRTLEEAVFDSGPMRGRPLQRLATGLASALAAIHGAGVIHRDLKPGNVMILDSEPVLIDFGIAQGMDATRLTATGMVIGTPGYLAPEIIEGEEAGAAADVHSWAATLVYAATGRPPFGSGTFESIFYKIMQGTPDLDGVPEAMLPLIRTAMAHHPVERPTAVTLVQLARRIDLDATVTDQTRADAPIQVFTSPPPSPTRTPPQHEQLQQPKDFKGLLPPAAPPPPPPPP